VMQAAGMLMLSFGVIALVKPELLVEIFDYVPRLTDFTSKAGFDVQSTVEDSALFMVVLGSVVGGVGLLGCAGACLRIRCMLSTVSQVDLYRMSVYLIYLTFVVNAELF